MELWNLLLTNRSLNTFLFVCKCTAVFHIYHTFWTLAASLTYQVMSIIVCECSGLGL